jgi:uncharacterized DUF497 family protein
LDLQIIASLCIKIIVIGVNTRYWLIVVSDLAEYVYAENIQCMVNLGKITGFDWDEGNARKSQDKHAFTQGEAEQVFFNEPLLLLLDERHSKREARYHAYGSTNDGRKLHIAFTLREDGARIRVISARDMHRKERATYEKA